MFLFLTQPRYIFQPLTCGSRLQQISLGMYPGNEQSAGKHRSGNIRKGSKWLRIVLTESARAAARSKGTYLASQYRHLRNRCGSKKARRSGRALDTGDRILRVGARSYL